MGPKNGLNARPSLNLIHFWLTFQSTLCQAKAQVSLGTHLVIVVHMKKHVSLATSLGSNRVDTEAVLCFASNSIILFYAIPFPVSPAY